jgi:hypothetical protein
VVDAKFGVGGVLMSLFGRMRWGYGRILEGVGKIFLVIQNLKWELDLRLDFGMICGVGIRP